MPDLTTILQILVSTLALGGIYAISAIGLALIWGVMGMLNMAHGALMALGAYASVFAISTLGLPWYFGAPAAVAVGCLAGWIVFQTTVRWMLKSRTFETNIIVVSVGIAIVVKSLLIISFTGNPKRQPFNLSGSLDISGITLTHQSLLILAVTVVLGIALTWGLGMTRSGRAIRATAQNPHAAALMGIPAQRVFLQVLMIAGGLAAVSGLLVSSVANVSPSTGEGTMLKIFIICVVAGLGYIPGTIIVAFGMALFEMAIQYTLSAQWSYPLLLCAAILILIWRPSGIFGVERVVRN